jgi:hypothetical protein
MNQGTMLPGASFSSPMRLERMAKKTTTGPRRSTRTSFTSVPTSPESALTGKVAASTWGTAYTVIPASAPYW